MIILIGQTPRDWSVAQESVWSDQVALPVATVLNPDYKYEYKFVFILLFVSDEYLNLSNRMILTW